jgi:WD40 repeat protein
MMFRFLFATFAGAGALFLAAPSSPGQAQEKKDQPASAQSPDKRRAAIAEDHAITIIDGQTQRAVLRMVGHKARVTALAFSPDGKLLASGGADHMACLWDVGTGRALRHFRFTSAVNGVSFSPDGRTFTTREADKTVCEWDVATGKLLKQGKEN